MTEQEDKRAEAQQLLDDIGYRKFVHELFRWKSDPAVDFTHAVLGLVTEVYEFAKATDKVNAIEELGDFHFYGHAATMSLKIAAGMDPLAPPTLEEQAGTFSAVAEYGEIVRNTPGPDYAVDLLCNELLDDAKRWIAYDKAPDRSRVLARIGYLQSCLELAGDLGDDAQIGNVQLVNVMKLLKRYKGMKFTTEAALNRDTAAERQVLESAVAAS